ncbi:MAG: 3-oxoacyl-[acyl-carrier protein] reductase [Solirubrobacterales bacterium]|jgi:3-oxoacyl-[acyl-carrier protein] reductase|nr:3-oxoacyl-[acyl-carrier protein] reductase [Solirubrobacterales bacterium]MDX6662605.1 3-oxoacyl-[acyl-carrier protein] reductase [Solirubrobacterales bacterium]
MDEKTALVMGASRGIGRAIAAALAREGARVAMASRSLEGLEQACTTIDGETAAFEADSDDLERMSALPGEVAERFGPVEILVTNTGGPPFGGALDNSEEEWDAAYRSLVLAPRRLIEASLPGMRERGWGRIVNVSSTSVREPIPHLTLSNAMRMAAVGFFKTLAGEVGADGITVNTVATGRFATERLADAGGSLEAAEEQARRDVPAARLGRPEEYGDLVAFLCSARAAYLTGAVIPLDGGALRSV